MKTNFTKTIILSAVMSIGLFTSATAQTAYADQYNGNQYNDNGYNQTYNNQQNFDYYPSANVYFDVRANHYIYNNGGAWLTVNTLPAGICITNTPRYTVYHRGPQVWLDNSIHIRNYRPAYRQPVVAYNNRHDDFRRGGNFNHGNHRGGRW